MYLFNLFKKNPSKILEKEDEELKKTLAQQESQHHSILNAESKYAIDGDIEWLIGFWEDIWNNGGLLFRGSKWTFYLPDLYIETLQYDKAIALCKRIKKQTEYKEKADGYIERIEKLKAKEAKKK